MSTPGSWERRWHPVLKEWVVIASTTGERPWSGERVEDREEELPEFDPECYLCPGVTRASGETNPRYEKPFAYDNDFASMSLSAPDVHREGLLQRVEPARGICRVVCFSPKHNITFAEMTTGELTDVVSIWQEEYRTLGSRAEIHNVLIFANTGLVIGVSNPHPHGQIYATPFVPRVVGRELMSCSEYKEQNGACLFCDLVGDEIARDERVVYRNDHFLAFVPFFARYAYETYIVSRAHAPAVSDLGLAEVAALAETLRVMWVKYDNLFGMPFPNVMVLQCAPTDGDAKNPDFHFHVEFYPPMRDRDKMKYFGGFEYGGGNIVNPVAPEVAAARLRDASTQHYKQRS